MGMEKTYVNVKVKKQINTTWTIKIANNDPVEIEKFIKNIFEKNYFRGEVLIDGFNTEIVIPLHSISEIIIN